MKCHCCSGRGWIRTSTEEEADCPVCLGSRVVDDEPVNDITFDDCYDSDYYGKKPSWSK